MVTQVKSEPSAPQPIPYHHPAPSYKHETPFNGQPFVIEPSYLLKPYRPPQNFQPQPYQTPVNQHQVFHPVTFHQTPSYPTYHATVYQQPQYQGQVYQQSQVYQPPAYQTVYSSVALLYSTPVLAYSTQLSSFEPTHSQVPAVVSSAVRPVVETAAPSALYADVTGSSDVNELDKRYVPDYVPEAAKESGSQTPSKLADLVYIPKTVASLRSAAAAGGKAPENGIESVVNKDESATYEDVTQRNQTYAATENKEEKSSSVDYNKESSETTKTVDDPVTEISLQEEEATGDSGEKTVEQVSQPSSYKEEGGQKYGASVDSAGAAGTEEPAEKDTSDESDEETADEPAKSEANIGTEASTYENPKEVSQVTTDEAAYVEPEVNKYAANDSGEKSDVAQVQEEVTNYKEPSYQQESSLDAGSYTLSVDTTNYVAAEVTVQKEEPAYQEAPKPIIVEEPNAVAAEAAYKKEEPETFKPFYRLKPVIVEAKMMTEPEVSEVYREAEEEEETVAEIQTPEALSYPKGLEQVSSALYASVDTAKAEPVIIEEEDETEKPEYKNPIVYPNDYAVITKDVGLETYVPIEMVEVTSELPAPLIFLQDYNTQDAVKEVVLDAPVENVEASSSLPEVELPKTDDKYIFVQDFAQDTEQVTSQTEEVTNAEPVTVEVEDDEPVTKYEEPIFYPEESDTFQKIEKTEPVIQQVVQNEESSDYQVPVVVAEEATEIPTEKVEPEIDVSTDAPVVQIKEEPVVVESVYIKEAEKSAYITESLTSEIVGEAVEVPVTAVIAPVEKTESYATKTTYTATADKPAEYTPSSTQIYVPEKEVAYIAEVEAVPVASYTEKSSEYQTPSTTEEIVSVPAVSYEKEVPVTEAVPVVSYETEAPTSSYPEPEVVTDKTESVEESSVEVTKSVKEEVTPSTEYSATQGAITVDLTPVVAYSEAPVYGTPAPDTSYVVGAAYHVVEDSSEAQKVQAKIPETKPVEHAAPCAFSGLRGPGSLHFHTAALANLPLDSYETSKEEEPVPTTVVADVVTPTPAPEPSYSTAASKDSSSETATPSYSSDAPKVASSTPKDSSAEEVQISTAKPSYTSTAPKDTSAEVIKTTTAGKPSYTTAAPKDTSAEEVKTPAPTKASYTKKDTSAEETASPAYSSLEPSTSTVVYKDAVAEESSPAYSSPAVELPSSTVAYKDSSAEVGTTAAPVINVTRKFTPRSRFYTNRPSSAPETAKPSTAAPALVVIGKPTEVRKPINGKLYARTSSIPQIKPPSLPQVKILPSRLRIPTPAPAQHPNKEQLDRRYFVGRPPVAYETRDEEEEADVY